MNTSVKTVLALTLLLFGKFVYSQTFAIKSDQMLDVMTGEIHSPAVIVVKNGVIDAINPSSLPANIEVIDLGEKILLPGLIDTHTHVTSDFFTGNEWTTAGVKQTAPDWALQGVRFAREVLDNGFTTICDLGAFPGVPDVALMRAIEAGHVPGPDIWPAGHAISITGGHCDSTGFAPGVMDLGPEAGIADGVTEAKHGVRVIKVCATAGVFSFSQNAQVGVQQYSSAELEAIVNEARRLGLKVAAHAHGTEGINAAILAGVDSIEHGTFLVPQTYVNGFELAPDTPLATVKKSEYLRPFVIQSFKMAYQAKLKMAFGSDNGVFPHKDT